MRMGCGSLGSALAASSAPTDSAPGRSLKAKEPALEAPAERSNTSEACDWDASADAAHDSLAPDTDGGNACTPSKLGPRPSSKDEPDVGGDVGFELDVVVHALLLRGAEVLPVEASCRANIPPGRNCASVGW